MNIEIQQETIDQAIEGLVQSGVKEAIKSYRVEAAVKERLGLAFQDGNLAESIKQGVANVNTDQITQAIALQLQRSSTHLVSELLGEAVAKLIADMRGLRDYDDDDKAERRRLAEECKLSMRQARTDQAKGGTDGTP